LDCNSAEGVKIPEGMSKTKLVNFAMANKARRKIINFLANGDRDIEEIEGIIGEKTLDFHLKIFPDAGLVPLQK
jgi:DNA-binding transcriptional ArsR family regulator